MNTPKTSGPLQPATAKRGNGKPNPVEVATREAMPKPRGTTTAQITLILGEVGKDEYLSRHAESRLKTPKQQLAMRRLFVGLQQTGAKTEDGRPVTRLGDVLRWLLEQI